MLRVGREGDKKRNLEYACMLGGDEFYIGRIFISRANGRPPQESNQGTDIMPAEDGDGSPTYMAQTVSFFIFLASGQNKKPQAQGLRCRSLLVKGPHRSITLAPKSHHI